MHLLARTRKNLRDLFSTRVTFFCSFFQCLLEAVGYLIPATFGPKMTPKTDPKSMKNQNTLVYPENTKNDTMKTSFLTVFQNLALPKVPLPVGPNDVFSVFTAVAYFQKCHENGYEKVTQNHQKS